MRFLTADHVFSAHTGFIPGGVLALQDDGTVADLLDPRKTEDLPAAKKFAGVLCPGFVNAHCHLELSHLRGQIEKHTGFVGFALQLLPKRGMFSPEQIAEAIVSAEAEMFRNGINGVGDISNTADTFAQKAESKLRYHTFIELLALHPAMAADAVKNGLKLRESCPQPATLSPHAPYTVSYELVKRISETEKTRGPLTIHSEESPAEMEFLEKGTGPMRRLYDFLGLDISFYTPPGKTPLRALLDAFGASPDLLLVHNTLTSGEDVRWAEQQHPKLHWCFCPNANLYIENTLPHFRQFVEAGVQIVVGTDSLASNDRLCILDELKVIAENAPEIPAERLLAWATKNGADALRFDDLGTFEKGKKPGVIQLTGLEDAPPSSLPSPVSLRMSAAAEVARVI